MTEVCRALSCKKLATKRCSGTGSSGKIVFFFQILPPLPRQHWTCICGTEKCQPIGVTVRSHSVENFEDIFQRCMDRVLDAIDFFSNTLYKNAFLLCP